MHLHMSSHELLNLQSEKLQHSLKPRTERTGVKFNLCADVDLPCEREAGNSHNPQAIAIKKVINGTLAASYWARA